MESWYLTGLGGVLGLVLGSFLNVCSLRWPQDQSVVSPPSRCPHCERQIRWHENVPVLGWIVLGGRCRGCGARISVQYPLVELATGLIWAGMVWQHGASWEAARGAFFLTILLGIAVSDARFYIIPDQFSVGGAILGIALAFAPAGLSPREALVGAVMWAVGLWVVGKAGTLYI
ncbi:MAG: prepilin peptidase, partial [Gemmatimonadales bacterium]